MHHAAKLGRTSLISDEFQWHPQTLSSPPPQGQVFAGTKDSAGCIGPVSGLRPLNVSRVKCGADLVAATKSFREREIRYAFNAIFIIAESLISVCQKHVVAATGPSPFKVGDNQRPERTMSGVRKPSPESSVPGETLTGGKEAESILQGIWKPIRA